MPADADGNSVGGEDYESEIDDTVYAPPPEAALPDMVMIGEGRDGKNTAVSSEAVGERWDGDGAV